MQILSTFLDMWSQIQKLTQTIADLRKAGDEQEQFLVKVQGEKRDIEQKCARAQASVAELSSKLRKKESELDDCYNDEKDIDAWNNLIGLLADPKVRNNRKGVNMTYRMQMISWCSLKLHQGKPKPKTEDGEDFFFTTSTTIDDFTDLQARVDGRVMVRK